MASGRSLLFVAPVFPAPAGVGPALRSQVFLDAFSKDFDVHLVVVPLVGLPPDASALRALGAQCGSVQVVEPEPFEDPAFAAMAQASPGPDRDAALAAYGFPILGRFSRQPLAAAVAATQHGRSFEVVHIARLYLGPLAGEWAGVRPRPLLQLDLDDWESRTQTSLAALMDSHGEAGLAQVCRAEAEKYRWWEQALLRRFDRVLVCSERDRGDLAAAASVEQVVVVPNAVPIPETVPVMPVDGGFTLLFVASLDYLPNADAAFWLVDEILPALRQAAAAPVRLVIAGPNAPDLLRTRARVTDDVELAGWVDDLDERYARSHVVVAPIRAGGGTRIKVLEAFAHRRPVVATRAAVDGISADAGVHYHEAADTAGFVRQCLAVMTDPAECRSMVDRAFELVCRDYDRERVIRLIRDLPADAPRPADV